MGRNNNLTQEDLQNLLNTKIKEPGITLDQLYTDISRIHPKPYLKFYISVVLWLVSFVLILSLMSTTLCSIFFLLFVLSSLYVIFLQKKHTVIMEVPWYILTGVAIVALGVCQPKLQSVGITDYLINLVSKLFNGRTS